MPEHNNQILRGRQEIADFIGVELKAVDTLIDLGVIAVFRLREKGMIFTTQRLVLEGFENSAMSRQSVDPTNLFPMKGAGKKRT